MKPPALSICLSLLLCAGPARAAEEFTVAALPDTQNYAQDYPEIYHAQTQWLAEQQAARNILFVAHLGDIVNEAATIPQWVVAAAAMERLDDGEMPYGTCVGNHDIRYPDDYYDPDGENYLAFFGPQFYEGLPWYGGASPSGLSNYQVVSVGDFDMLFLHLCVETPAAELAWAQGILSANRDKPTLVSTHRYLYDWRELGAGRYGDFEYTFEPLYRHDGIKADDFFYGFIAPNRQIFMVLCGHCDGEYRQVSTNSFGLEVHEILADFQSTYGAGGNGWLRLMRFQPDQNQIFVQTYSPWLDDYLTGSASQFTLNVDLADYATGNPVLRFQQGEMGYSGTQDTWINEAEKSASYGGSDEVVVDDDTTDGWWGYDYQGQGLFRFDGMFQEPVYEGDPAPTAVPLGSTIHAATMTINLADNCDLGDPEFYVYRMTRSWGETSTWNSLGDGITPGEDTDPTMVTWFYGDNKPDLEYYRHLDVTPAVQAWSDGAPNDGLAILPERLDFNDDGITIWSSESDPLREDPITGAALPQPISMRPAMDVEFSYVVINVPPTVTEPLAASAVEVDEGDEIELTMSATDPNPLDPLVFLVNGEAVGYATGAGSLSHPAVPQDEGVYAFEGAVSDDEETVDAGQVAVTVYNLPPTITEITADLSVETGEVFEFAAAATDPGILDELVFAWDLDEDGQYDDFVGEAGEWSFAAQGTYVVRLEVTDGDGGADHAQFDVDVGGASQPGDCDGDGDVDLDDFHGLFDCLLGPDDGLGADCGCFDLDANGRVDLLDFAAFQAVFTD